MNRELLKQALSALEMNHEWHQNHDDYDGYHESDYCDINLAAINAIKVELSKSEIIDVVDRDLVASIGNTGCSDLIWRAGEHGLVRDYEKMADMIEKRLLDN